MELLTTRQHHSKKPAFFNGYSCHRLVQESSQEGSLEELPRRTESFPWRLDLCLIERIEFCYT